MIAGEPGAMVSSTLKLGISILNGGNSDVQQVRTPWEDLKVPCETHLRSVRFSQGGSKSRKQPPADTVSFSFTLTMIFYTKRQGGSQVVVVSLV